MIGQVLLKLLGIVVVIYGVFDYFGINIFEVFKL